MQLPVAYTILIVRMTGGLGELGKDNGQSNLQVLLSGYGYTAPQRDA